MLENLSQSLKVTLAPPTWRALAATIRLQHTARPAGPVPGPVIFACLHRDIIPAILHVRPAQPTLLVSKSPDGNILIGTLTPLGFHCERGSTGHAGGRGFLRLLSALRDGHNVGLAVDGPKGPFGVVRDGVIQLSRRAQSPVIPLVVSARRCHRLGTWDRTVVPWPFSRVSVTEGHPMLVTREATEEDMDRQRQRLAEILLGRSAEKTAITSFSTRDEQGGSEPCLP